MTGFDAEVIVVGGGPVGLFLGCALGQNGIACHVLEKRSSPSVHTRSIGIHPPALEALAEIGVADDLIAKGIRVQEGSAWFGTQLLGRLSFDACPPPYRFVLAIPQYETERILEERLHRLNAEALVHDSNVTGIKQDTNGVSIDVVRHGRKNMLRARYLVGADGHHSTVRSALGIDFHGRKYDDTYMMGDFRDDTDLGPTAAILLTEAGVVESFPLPGGVRRWVVYTSHETDRSTPVVLAGEVHSRTGQTVDFESNTMISDFGVYTYLASRMVAGRVLLVGDAAHVVSPIGGQGMNLGWLDSSVAAAFLVSVVRTGSDPDRLFAIYDRVRRRAAARARRRAEFNMWMGRPGRFDAAKCVAIKAVLRSPLNSYFARRFTMRGL